MDKALDAVGGAFPFGFWIFLGVKSADLTEDGDGLLASRLALQLPLMRASKQTSEVAIGVVDVRGCGILADDDLCQFQAVLRCARRRANSSPIWSILVTCSASSCLLPRQNDSSDPGRFR